MKSLHKQRGWIGAAITAGGALLGGIMGNRAQARMQEDQQQFNSAEALANREWQERMSNTSHQREVTDLKAAGLNPILSGTGGMGAATPSGANATSGIAPQHDVITPAISTAVQSYLTRQQADLVKEQANTEKQRGRIEATKANAVEAVGEKGQPYLDKGLVTIDNTIKGAAENLSGAVSSAYQTVGEPTRQALEKAVDYIQSLPKKAQDAILNSAKSGYEYSTKRNPKKWSKAKEPQSARATMGTLRGRGVVPSRKWE